MIDVTPSVPNIVSKSARGFLFNWTKLPVAFNSFVIQFELNPVAVVDNSRICFEARSRGEKKKFTRPKHDDGINRLAPKTGGRMRAPRAADRVTADDVEKRPSGCPHFDLDVFKRISKKIVQSIER